MIRSATAAPPGLPAVSCSIARVSALSYPIVHTTMQSRDALVVFARFPTPGKVKTRLAASIGAERAATFYKHCAEAVIRELSSLADVCIYVFYSADQDGANMALWLSPLRTDNMQLLPQLGEPDLGARMHHAMHFAFSRGHQRVAIVGTDAPDLSSHAVRKALQHLDQHEVVFGPAEDGGYYLLALSVLPQDLFQGIPWSTGTVLHANADRARHTGLSVAPLDTLETLQDIDTLQDLQCWCQRQQRGRQERAGQLGQPCSLLQLALQVLNEIA